MKTISFKKLALIFSVVTIVGYSIVLACADGWFYYDYNSNFTPEVFVDKSYSPLFFAPDETFYGNGFDTNYNGRFNDDIVSEWTEYLGAAIPAQQLSFLLLTDTAAADIPKLYDAAKKKTKAPSPYTALALTDPKVKGFVDFLYHAKAIEKASNTVIDPWDYDPNAPKEFVTLVTRSSVEKLFNEASDPFLKNRFWFQTMKAYFYSANQKDLLTFFDKTKATQAKNSLYYRGISYVAGVHYRAKNFGTANYLYSVVFDEFAPLRQVAAYNFHPRDDADFDASLALASTNKQKAALWALIGYYGDEADAIREIYKIDPANQHLAYLLTRMINKQEAAINNSSFSSSKEYIKAMHDNVNTGALQLVEQIAKADNAAQPDLWLIAAGYMNTFAGKFQQAASYFDKVKIKAGDNDVVQQVRLLRLINTVCSLEKMDAAAEKKLLAELQWIQKGCEAGEGFRCSHVIGWSNKYISSLYAEANNRVMAELFSHSEKYYRTSSDLEAMKAFLQGSTSHTDLQKFVLKHYPISLSDIHNYQSVMSTYAGDLDAAINFIQISTDQSSGLPGNPFNGKIKDCHDCDHTVTQKVTYTKLSLLMKMKEMKANVDIGNDIYSNSLLLANAYYNITYHGNARAFYAGDVMNQSGNDIDPFYHLQLLSCTTAQKYYQLAFDAATTPEQKAKCVYMIAKCERNEYYNKTVYTTSGDFDEDFVSWPSFKKLQEEYFTTKYYQEVLKECGYFKTYVSR